MKGLRSLRLGAIGIALLAPGLAFGGGFALYEHGARAVGMGGAFGATADDPSAGYYNPAGLAFLDGYQASAGAFLITESSKLYGADPYPGRGYTSEMEGQVFYPPNFHVTGPLGGNFRWGLSMTAPFGLGTWWPSDYAGKYISKRVDLKVFNVNPNLAYKFNDYVAVAVGIDYYMSKVDLTKSLGAINPFTQSAAEVGQVHLYNDKWATGTGYNGGVLVKLGGGFSVGASYRGRVKVKYDNAKASFTQFFTGNEEFDNIVAAMLPFGQQVPGYTEINYPSEMRFAMAWHNENWTVEFDSVRVGWKSFQNLPITLPSRPDLSSVREEDYRDTTASRLGVEYRTGGKWAWQFGVLKDPTPVPTASVSPLLPDANRWGYSIGTAYQMSKATRFEVSFLHLPFDNRSTDGLDRDNFNGKYKTRAELLGFSLVHTF